MFRIKICGIRTPAEALEIAAAGANALGVIVATTAKSEHAVPLAQAHSIFHALQMDSVPVKRVLVTHETNPERLQVLLEACPLTQEVQLHAPMDAALFRQNLELLRSRGIDAVRALHITPGTSLNGLEAVARQSAGALAILLDSATSDRLGGTGATHDWSVSGEIVRLSPVPVILAGGLWRDNVRAAITQVRPAGIDLNTGAREQRDRHRPQSAARVRELVQEVRAVEARLPAPKLSLAW